jgi:hypothetical protein
MDVIEINNYDITLDLPWLRKYKSNINYKKEIIIFNNYNYSSQLEIEEILLKKITRQFQSDPDLVRLAVVRLNNIKINYIIPEWYKKFQKTFNNKKDIALSKY